MKNKLMNIAKFMQKNIKADDYELWVSCDDTQNTRFAQNSITQHIHGDTINVYLKVVIDKKVGSVSTGQVDKENLLLTIKKACELAENNSPDPDIAPTMSKEDFKEIENYFPSIEK